MSQAIVMFIFSIFSAQAQNPSAFNTAYAEVIKCLEDTATLSDRKICYALCDAVVDAKKPNQALECSRLKRITEKSAFDKMYGEEEESDKKLKNVHGLIEAQCSLLNLMRRNEYKINECVSDEYFSRQESLVSRQDF